jgi:hypothetical protein
MLSEEGLSTNTSVNLTPRSIKDIPVLSLGLEGPCPVDSGQDKRVPLRKL